MRKSSAAILASVLSVVVIVSAAFAVTTINTRPIDLLARDHAEISCTNPLVVSLKAFTPTTLTVIFRVYKGTSSTLLWTSAPTTYTVSSPFTDVNLVTTISQPQPLVRVEMHDSVTGQLLSKLLLEPDCKPSLVSRAIFIFPPPLGKIIVNPPRWPTTTVVVPASNIGKTIEVRVVLASNTAVKIGDSGLKTIATEMVQLQLTGCGGTITCPTGLSPFPANSFFDVFFYIDVGGVAVTTSRVTVLNGQPLEHPTVSTTTVTVTTTATTTSSS
ncbi:MAG: hypothetical protein HY296_04365 [Thaumarchaeota archaeon]|nr:hypothetical protein [Nitrososphaerota archaeon]